MLWRPKPQNYDVPVASGADAAAPKGNSPAIPGDSAPAIPPVDVMVIRGDDAPMIPAVVLCGVHRPPVRIKPDPVLPSRCCNVTTMPPFRRWGLPTSRMVFIPAVAPRV